MLIFNYGDSNLLQISPLREIHPDLRERSSILTMCIDIHIY